LQRKYHSVCLHLPHGQKQIVNHNKHIVFSLYILSYFTYCHTLHIENNPVFSTLLTKFHITIIHTFLYRTVKNQIHYIQLITDSCSGLHQKHAYIIQTWPTYNARSQMCWAGYL